MLPPITLFIAADFIAYGKHAEEVAVELNKILQHTYENEVPFCPNTLNQLRNDIISEPNVYLSDTVLCKLYVEQNNNSTPCPHKK